VTSGDAPLAIDRAGPDAAFSALERCGYTLVGPTGRDRAIDSIVELPAGCPAVQDAVDEVSRELRARLVKPEVGRPAGPNARRAPSP
jgi:hypothetical protein